MQDQGSTVGVIWVSSRLMKLSQSALLNLQLFPGQWPVLVIQFLYGGRCCKNQVCVSSPHSSQSHLAHWPLLWSNNHFHVMSQSPMHVPIVAALFPPEEANLTHTRIINLPFCYQLTWPATCAGKDRSLQHEWVLLVSLPTLSPSLLQARGSPTLPL